MDPYLLLKVLILFVLCKLVCCINFYMLENTELVNEKILKRVELNLQPTESLANVYIFMGVNHLMFFTTNLED